MVRSTQDCEHLVGANKLLLELPLPIRELALKTIAQFLVAPCRNEGGAEVVMVMELNATPLMLHSVKKPFLPVSFPKHGVHHIEDPVPFENVKGCIVHCLNIGHIVLVEGVHSLHV